MSIMRYGTMDFRNKSEQLDEEDEDLNDSDNDELLEEDVIEDLEGLELRKPSTDSEEDDVRSKALTEEEIKAKEEEPDSDEESWNRS